MAASTAARYDLSDVKDAYIEYGVLADTAIYYGTAVAVTAAGFLVPAADTSGLIYVGISQQTVTGSGTSGAVKCRVARKGGLVQFNATSPAAAWVGDIVSFTDDHTVAIASTTTNDIAAGRVVRVDSTAAAGKVTVDTGDTSAPPAAA